MTLGRRPLALVLGALAVLLAVIVAVVVVGNPFGQSVSERVSDEVDAKARCREAGLQVLAGERETVYTCTYRAPTLKDHPITSTCFAIVDGRVYSVSADPC